MDFTPTAEKLIPDLSPARGAGGPGPGPVARGLQRPPGRPHHGQPGRRDAAVQSVAPHLGRAAPAQVLRIDLDGRVVEGDWPVPLGIPLHLETAQAARRRGVGRAQPPALRHGVGRHGRDPSDPRPELGSRRRRAGPGQRVRRSGQRPGQRPAGRRQHGRRPRRPCWPATASSSWAARPGPCTSGRWPSSNAASGPGTSGPPGAPAPRRCPAAFLDFMAASDGEGFIGFWEAAVRAELRADPHLLGESA